MYKKHELIIGFIFWNNIFRHMRIFWKLLKKEKKMVESSRSISPIKKKVKRSKLAWTTTTKKTLKSEWKNCFLHHKRTKWCYSQQEIVKTAHITLFFCDIIKCAVFLLNMKFERYLKVLNNKSIMLKRLITVGIWKFCIVGNLSDENYSTSAARFCCIVCDETWSQLKITNNILLSKFWGIKGSFSFSKCLSKDIFLLNKLSKEAVYSGMLETSILFIFGKIPGKLTYWA